MTTTKFFYTIITLYTALNLCAQNKEFFPDLSDIDDEKIWSIYNRSASYRHALFVDGRPGDGIIWLENFEFSNGQIELDIKGKNSPGKSFVGIAFHGLNDSTYDAIYFRPFNFANPKKDEKSVQYISHPDHTWYSLRKEHPGRYENRLNPVPKPEEWFHVNIIIDHPVVKVFVNNSLVPSLTVNQLSKRKSGMIGLWVGNNSDGYFRNLKVIKE